MVTQVHEPRARPDVAAARPANRTGAPRRAAGRRGRGGRIEGLDGLRALAVVAVLVFHLRAESLPGGFLGVDVFFVVSGFLITTLLLRELATGRVNLAGFWLRRARRLLPALLAVVVVSVPAAWAAGTDLLVGIGRQVVGALTFTTNWVEIGAGSSYFDTTAPQVFAHFWSLAVEEQFYLLWPLLLVALVTATSSARTRVRLALGGALVSAVLMALLFTPGEDATRVYYGTDTHAFSLLVGVALAFWWSEPRSFLASAAWRRSRDVVALGALAGLIVLMLTLRETTGFTFRGGILLAALLSAVLIAALLGRPGLFQRAMRIRALEWVGQRSYGIYLWHWPAIVILTLLVPAAHDSPQHWAVRGVALVLTLVLSAASYRWLETPVRRYGFRGSLARFRNALAGAMPSRRAAARVIVGTTALLVVLSGVAIAVAPDRTSTQARIEAAEDRIDAAENDGARNDAPGAGGPIQTEEPDPNADFSMPSGAEITAFGDSLVVTSADGLEHHLPGIMLDARSNRQWRDAPAVVRAALQAGTVRRAVLLHFGTNAGVTDPDVVRGVLDAFGPNRMVVVLTVYGSSHWVPDTNEALAEIVADYPNAIIGDWAAAAAEHPELLQADRTHPGIEGAHLYAKVVEEAFAALSERLTGVPVELETPTDEDVPDEDVPGADEPPADGETSAEDGAPATDASPAAAEPVTEPATDGEG